MAMSVLPLVLTVVLLTPVWIAAAFPTRRNQTVVLELIDRLRGWHREILDHVLTEPDHQRGHTHGGTRQPLSARR
jgi:hypothetical protein